MQVYSDAVWAEAPLVAWTEIRSRWANLVCLFTKKAANKKKMH